MFNVFSMLGFANPVEGVEFISALEAKEMMDGGEADILIDVRPVVQFGVARIPGAVNLPVLEMEKDMSNMEEYRDKKAILYCNTQNQSSHAARVMKSAGFKNFKVMQGGITDWHKLGYAIES